MSAAPPASVAGAAKDALRASASASVAPTAASPAAAASSSSSLPAPLPTAEHELAAVKQLISDVADSIAGVEAEIAAAKQARDASPAGSEQRQELSAELQRLGRKEDRLREEKALLLKKEEQLRDELKRKELELQQEGQCTTLSVADCIVSPAKFVPSLFL